MKAAKASKVPQLEEVLQNLPLSALKILCENHLALPQTKKKLSSSTARQLILAEVRHIAVRGLCENLNKRQLEALVPLPPAPPKTSSSSEDEASTKSKKRKKSEREQPVRTRTVLSKRLTKLLEEVGIAAHLTKHADEDLLNELSELWNLDGSKKKSEDTIRALVIALEYEALEAYLSALSLDQLHDVCFEMKNEHALPETTSKRLLVQSILTDCPVSELVEETAGKKKPPSKPKKSKKKPKIEKGVTYDDLYQWYNWDELQEFAKENKFKSSGTKKEVIKRILAFLNEESLEPKKKKRKQSDSNKKKKKKKKNQSSAKGKNARPDDLQDIIKKIVAGARKVNPPLTDEEIDRCEKEYQPKGLPKHGIKLPDALREVFRHADGFEISDDLRFFSLLHEKSKEPLAEQRSTLFVEGEEAWLEYEVKNNGLQDESQSVAHPTWIPVAFWGEYSCYFMNADPQSEWYGSIKSIDTNLSGERHVASHLGEFLATVLNYVEAVEVAREIVRLERADEEEEEEGDGEDEDEDEEKKEKNKWYDDGGLISFFPVDADEREELDKELAELKKKATRKKRKKQGFVLSDE